MKKNNFYKRALMLLAIVLGIVSVGSATVAADSDESGSAVVSFTQQVLNPNNPRLPLADTSGEPANTAKPSTNTKKTVVVDTTPEKTKVTETSTSSSTKHATLPATSGRRSLPQTGTATMPIVLVMISIAMGLMMGWQVLKNGRNLAE